jgi:DNA-binding response OmpR family regulator
MHVVGDLRVDLDAHQAYVGDEPVALTRKEFHILAILIASPNVTIRRERLLAEVWHTSWRGTSRTLDVHVATLRSKIKPGAHIQTVRGVGYRITPEA